MLVVNSSDWEEALLRKLYKGKHTLTEFTHTILGIMDHLAQLRTVMALTYVNTIFG